MTSVGMLESLRRKALRARLWFKVLNSVERGIAELCIKVKRVGEIRSPRLLRVLRDIVRKLVRALGSPDQVEAWIRGFKAALTLSRIALSWGYRKAEEWAQDLNYITFLARAWIQTTPFNKP